MNLRERTYLWYIVLLRLYTGYYLLFQGIRKFQRDFPTSGWINRQIGDIAGLQLQPWYKNFLVGYVVPHEELFGWLVMIGEISAGACLLLGLLTRPAAALALFLLINYYLGPGTARGGAVIAAQQTFIMCLIVVLLANPGRTLGLDALRGGRR